MSVQRVYLTLLALHTLAASFIWGINTLFLLDAGLSNTQAFAANAFFTAGLVLFEVPTGVIADMRGRRLSYLLGTVTLIISTLVYLLMWRMEAPFWAWAITSAFLGLGFTFFSGAVQAWLVDAMKASDFKGQMESVFAKGEIVEGIAMLTGAVAGGFIAQFTNLGVPYILRAAVLTLSFVLAFILMRDTGFTPQRTSVKHVLGESVKHGLGNPPVRWVMLASIFTDGVSIYAFYAMQPYLLQLYGNPKAYGLAGVVAAIVGGAQIGGGLLAPRIARAFRRRTTVLMIAVVSSTAILAAIAVMPGFAIAIALFILWGFVFAAVSPTRQAYMNDLIPSEQRATVLSFDSLLGSSGGVVSQPLLGRAADVWGYPISYAWSAAIQAAAVPFVWLASRTSVRGQVSGRTTPDTVTH
jgi:MFS family permease